MLQHKRPESQHRDSNYRKHRSDKSMMRWCFLSRLQDAEEIFRLSRCSGQVEPEQTNSVNLNLGEEMHTTNESVILKKKRLKWQVFPFKLPKNINKTDFLGSFRLEHKPKGLIRKGKLGFAQYNQQDDTSSLTDLENTIFIKFLILAKRSSPRRKSNMLGH